MKSVTTEDSLNIFFHIFYSVYYEHTVADPSAVGAKGDQAPPRPPPAPI